jgi:hypothetical protein
MNSFINRTSKLVSLVVLSLAASLFASGCTFGVGISGEVVDTCAEYDVGYGESAAAYDCDVVYAYSGSHVDAYDGSTVYAYEGSTVYAHYGSFVYAYPGSSLYIESGAEIAYTY